MKVKSRVKSGSKLAGIPEPADFCGRLPLQVGHVCIALCSDRLCLYFMQCHGGLKGPLRRIIRSLGNDTVGSSCRSYPQRHLSGRATSSPPEPCSPARDRRPRAFDSSRRPNPRTTSGRDGCPAQRYSIQSSPPASHSEPEQKDEAHDDFWRQLELHEDDIPKSTLSDPNSAFNGGQNITEGSHTHFHTPSLHNASSETTNPPPDRVVIRRCWVDAPVKDTHQFSERYIANITKVSVSQTRNRLRAHHMQQERHDYESSDDWRVVLRMLDDHTTAGHKLYKKSLETVMLPKGVLARFRSNAGASLKEIQEHTGCHVQIRRGAPHYSTVVDAFAGLDLLGSPWQITHALKILPQYLDVMPAQEMVGIHASSNLTDHVLQRRVRSDEDMSLASISAPNTANIQEQDSLDEGDVENVEHQMDERDESSATITTPIRSVWAEKRTRRLNMYGLLDKRLKSLSTPLDVSAYVEDLCQPVPRLVHKALYKTRIPLSQQGHVRIVMEKLISLFSAPGVARMATSHAVDRAIRFLTKHNNFAAFRELYDALEDGGYTFTVSNWNCCLAAAAKVGDVHNYKYTLTTMLRHKVKPDPVTWATLHDLVCRRCPSETNCVLETMRNKGLLSDDGAAKLVAQNAVTNDLKAHLAQRGDLYTFYRLYDNRFGTMYGLGSFNWLTVDVANRMVAVLLSLGRSNDAFGVLSEIRKRQGERPLETVTMNTFLTSSLRDMDPASAVAIVKHFRVGQVGALVPNNVTYTILFAIAWRRRYFNMLRVIWRYACMSGFVGFSMRHRVEKNLNFFLPKQPVEDMNVSRENVWRALAAKFIIGISGGSGYYTDAPREAGLSILETQLLNSVSLGSLRPESSLHQGRKNFFRHVLTDDFTEATLSKPVLPLAELLRSAWEKDRAWKERGLGQAKNYSNDMFKEMLKDGIKVPIEAGDGILETRAWEIPALLRQNLRSEKVDDEAQVDAP